MRSQKGGCCSKSSTSCRVAPPKSKALHCSGRIVTKRVSWTTFAASLNQTTFPQLATHRVDARLVGIAGKKRLGQLHFCYSRTFCDQPLNLVGYRHWKHRSRNRSGPEISITHGF